MKTYKILAAVILTLVFLFGSAAGSAFAASNGTDYIGPFPSSIVGDTGSCGNNWANDTFNVSLTVHNNGDGTFNVTIYQTDGTFTTIGPTSPGACESTGHHGSTLQPGILGHLYGIVMGTVISSQYNPNACNGNPSPCNFFTFFGLIWGPTATNTITLFLVNYQSPDPSLQYHHWVNIITNNGNNVQLIGDIANE